MYRRHCFVFRVAILSLSYSGYHPIPISPRLTPRIVVIRFSQLTSVPFLLFQAWQVAPARAGHLTSARDAPEDCSTAFSMCFFFSFIHPRSQPRCRDVLLRLMNSSSSVFLFLFFLSSSCSLILVADLDAEMCLYD